MNLDFIWIWPLGGFGSLGFFMLMFHLWEKAEGHDNYGNESLKD